MAPISAAPRHDGHRRDHRRRAVGARVPLRAGGRAAREPRAWAVKRARSSDDPDGSGSAPAVAALVARRWSALQGPCNGAGGAPCLFLVEHETPSVRPPAPMTRTDHSEGRWRSRMPAGRTRHHVQDHERLGLRPRRRPAHRLRLGEDDRRPAESTGRLRVHEQGRDERGDHHLRRLELQRGHRPRISRLRKRRRSGPQVGARGHGRAWVDLQLHARAGRCPQALRHLSNGTWRQIQSIEESTSADISFTYNVSKLSSSK